MRFSFFLTVLLISLNVFSAQAVPESWKTCKEKNECIQIRDAICGSPDSINIKSLNKWNKLSQDNAKELKKQNLQKVSCGPVPGPNQVEPDCVNLKCTWKIKKSN